jgi:hypothetical protein
MSHEATHLLGAFTAEREHVPPETLPYTSTRAPAPDALQCLRCQLLGRRRLLCSRGDICRELPHVYPLGPILLAGWLVTAVAFVIAVM